MWLYPLVLLAGSPSSVGPPARPGLGQKDEQKKHQNTYNSGDSLVVTHLTTNPPVSCLYMAERTGSLIFMILWSYVKECVISKFILAVCIGPAPSHGQMKFVQCRRRRKQ